MGYTYEQITSLESKYEEVHKGLKELMLETVLAGQESHNARVREHLVHGAGRRLDVLIRCLENIFRVFPLGTTKPLNRDMLHDLQINIHAYVINLYGISDNWAWSFVYRHDLLNAVGGRKQVGLFHNRTNKYFSQPLRSYLTSQSMTDWHESYLKSFRDALAHRIPLYVPPAEFTEEEGRYYNRLENEKIDLIKAMKWQRLDELYEEQEKIGRPSFCFHHSFEEEASKSILFHPQLLCDGLTIIECGSLFMEHWNDVSS